MQEGRGDAPPQARAVVRTERAASVAAAEPVSRWTKRYLAGVLAGDAVGVLLAGLAAEIVRFGDSQPTPLSRTVHVPYALVSVGLAPLWLLTLAVSGVFDRRRLGVGTDEYRAIAQASFRFLGLVCSGAFLLRLGLFSRGYVLLLLPLTPGITVFVHWRVRRWLHRHRALGQHQRRTVIVGSPIHVSEFIRHIRNAPYAGFDVVAACLPPGAAAPDGYGEPVQLLASLDELVGWLKHGGAEQVVIADTTIFRPGQLRRFAWDLELVGVDLIVAPTITQFAGPRISVRQAGGLPLLHVEAPRLDGFQRVVKGTVERLFAAALLLMLSPFLGAVAIAVKLTSKGPVLYRQSRIGKSGELFMMLKFRTMVDGADALVDDLEAVNQADGCLFKIREDPRVTPLGRILRRFSIDELPQLVHVLSGRMAVVGPRPLPAKEFTRYDDEARRRLLVLPGLTGLWQISGRWELSWMESVRLDLYYIENWSLALDAVIVAKTLGAILREQGSS